MNEFMSGTGLAFYMMGIVGAFVAMTVGDCGRATVLAIMAIAGAVAVKGAR